VTETVAQKIRDDIIAQDVRYRRVDAAVRREVDDVLDKLEQDLRVLMIRIDVAGTKQRVARQRRLKKLQSESGILIRTAYSEINRVIRSASRRVAKVEAKKVNTIVQENLP
jgi:chaperonin cofactor prefoldin